MDEDADPVGDGHDSRVQGIPSLSIPLERARPISIGDAFISLLGGRKSKGGSEGEGSATSWMSSPSPTSETVGDQSMGAGSGHPELEGRAGSASELEGRK